MKEVIFADRSEAGRKLAEELKGRGYGAEPTLVLGIPRGGVIVAAEVARALNARLDVTIARKIRAPHQPELGIGAVIDGDSSPILNEELLREVGTSREYLEREIAFQRREIERRLQLYRAGRPASEVSGKVAITIDDGIATGYTFRAALEGLRRRNPRRLAGAVPVAAYDSVEMLKPFADELICLSAPSSFFAVGAWYRNFDQTTDDEVAAILQRNWSQFEGHQSP